MTKAKATRPEFIQIQNTAGRRITLRVSAISFVVEDDEYLEIVLHDFKTAVRVKLTDRVVSLLKPLVLS